MELNLSLVTRDAKGNRNVSQYKSIAEAIKAGAKAQDLNVSTFCQKSEIESAKAELKRITGHTPQIIKPAFEDKPDGQWVVQYSANLSPGIEANEVEAFFRGTHPLQTSAPTA